MYEVRHSRSYQAPNLAFRSGLGQKKVPAEDGQEGIPKKAGGEEGGKGKRLSFRLKGSLLGPFHGLCVVAVQSSKSNCFQQRVRLPPVMLPGSFCGGKMVMGGGGERTGKCKVPVDRRDFSPPQSNTNQYHATQGKKNPFCL